MRYITINIVLLLFTITFFSCSDGENGVDGIDGVDGANGADGADGANGADGSIQQGLEFLILAGDITQEEAAQIIAEDLGKNTHTLLVLGTTNLTTLDIPGISSLNEIEIMDNQKLQRIALPNLETVADRINIRDNVALTSTNFEKLTVAESISYSNNLVLNSVNFDMLIEVFSDISIRENPAIPTIVFPALKTASNLSLGLLDNLSTFEAPALETTERLAVGSDVELSIDISSIQNFESIGIFSEGNLSTASIDNLMTRLVNIDPAITGKTIDISGTASAQAEIDAQTLRDNGNTVSFDDNAL